MFQSLSHNLGHNLLTRLPIYYKKMQLSNSPMEQPHRVRYAGKGVTPHAFSGCTVLPSLHVFTTHKLSEPHPPGFS